MKKYLLLLVLPIILNLEIYADENIFNISLNLSGSGLTMSLFDNGNTENHKDFTPNNPFSLSIGLFYNGLGTYLGKGISVGDMVDDIETTYDDYQIYFYLDKIGFELFYQKYKGYYHESEYSTFIEAFNNMKMETSGLNVLYKIKGNNPLSSIKTAGVSSNSIISSLIYTEISISKRTLNSDLPLISGYEEYSFVQFKNIKDLEFIIPSASIGALLEINLGLIGITPGLSLGYGFPISNCEISPTGSIKGSIKSNMEINLEPVVFGSKISGDFDAINIKKSQGMQFNSFKIDFYFSYTIKS